MPIILSAQAAAARDDDFGVFQFRPAGSFRGLFPQEHDSPLLRRRYIQAHRFTGRCCGKGRENRASDGCDPGRTANHKLPQHATAINRLGYDQIRALSSKRDAIHNQAGISAAKTVVAVNVDREADIFTRANYGVVGDYREVLPAFIERVKQLRS